MKIAGLLALCALSASCAAIRTQDAPAGEAGGEAGAAGAGGAGGMDFDRPGAYGGVSLIQGFEDFDTPGGTSANDSDLGLGLRGGVRLRRNLAIEGVIEDVRGYEIEAGPASEDLDMLTVGVQGKYYFATDRVQPYGLAGFGVARADVDRFDLDESGTYFRIGVGADLVLTRDVAAFGELQINRMFGDIEDLDYASFHVGLAFKF
jgi:opacity protein-like surface antigen